MGIAFFPDAGESYKEVYICADKALYEAKRSEETVIISIIPEKSSGGF